MLRPSSLTAFFTALVCSSAAQAETLAEAIASAYQANPTIQSGRYDLQAVDETLVQAKSQIRPTAQLNVSAAYARTVRGRAAREGSLGSRAYNQDSSRLEVQVEQPLYTGGRATAARQVAFAQIRSQREALRSTEGDLLLGVITAYVDVRRFQAALGVWQASVGDLEKVAQEVEARQVAGEVTKTDVAQANAQLSLARQQVAFTEQALEGARADYAALVGRDPGMLTAAPVLPSVPARVEDAFVLAEQLNPELQAAVFVEQGSFADIAAAKAQGRPAVSLRGTAALIGEALPYRVRDQDESYTGTLVLNMPISAGGLVASQIRQAEARNGSDRFRIEAERRNVNRSVNYAWNQMVTSDKQADLQDEQRKFAEIQLDGMLNEYRVGLRSTFDVLYAQQQLRDTEVALLGSERDRYIARATLLRQTGLLEARTIMSGVSLHDPEEHLRDIEHKNAVPWDSIFAGIDKLASPKARHRRLKYPHASASPTIGEASRAEHIRQLSQSLPYSRPAESAAECGRKCKVAP